MSGIYALSCDFVRDVLISYRCGFNDSSQLSYQSRIELITQIRFRPTNRFDQSNLYLTSCDFVSLVPFSYDRESFAVLRFCMICGFSYRLLTRVNWHGSQRQVRILPISVKILDFTPLLSGGFARLVAISYRDFPWKPTN